MKTYIRSQQHKKLKHQDVKQVEPPQKYRLGTSDFQTYARRKTSRTTTEVPPWNIRFSNICN